MHWLRNLIPLVVLAALIWGVLKYLRPKLRERRHAAWERDGLLPEQVDPYGPDGRDDDRS